jgi:hypothetical protein
MLCDALQEAKIVEIYFNKTSIQLLKNKKNMENQEQTKEDSLNQEQETTKETTERTSSEEWKKRSARTMEILGSKMDFSDAGKCFVMPYKKPK